MTSTHRHPAVAVVIPAYRGGQHLGEAIQSVLGQTRRDWELVVVDDASPDGTTEVVRRFEDPRLTYIRHDENRGANAARNTGIRAASAEIVAFLDQDDLFHPEKLATHVDFLGRHPEIGATYGPRYELNHSASTVRGVWCPPDTLSLWDLVKGFPFSPSDLVVRRRWLEGAGLWDETHDFYGGEIILAGRMYLSGCRFASVRRVLNSRRRHANRSHGDLERHGAGELGAQEKIFADPRCPADVRARRGEAAASLHLSWAYIALVEGNGDLGRHHLNEVGRLMPAWFEGRPCRVASHLAEASLADDGADHEAVLDHLLSHLEGRLAFLGRDREWAVTRGYVVKGIRAVAWGRVADGRAHLARARQLDAACDTELEGRAAYEVAMVELAQGADAADRAARALESCLEEAGWRRAARRMRARIAADRAFASDKRGAPQEAGAQALAAVAADVRYLANRGVLAVLWRSAVRSAR